MALAASVALAASAAMNLIWPGPAAAGPTNYYLACSGANGSGTVAPPWGSLSQVDAHVFAPGDRLLIEDGATCTGTLQPRGSGDGTAPITIDSYGTGPAPVMDGNGAGAAIELHDVQGWQVRDLTITNPAMIRGSEKGIFVLLDKGFNGGVAAHYDFSNLRLHDIDGSPADVRGNGNGGIILRNTRADGRTHFADVQISHDSFTDVSGLGVETWNTNCRRANTWGGECAGAYAPSTGVAVSDNTFTRIGSGAVVPFTTDRALVDHNTVDGFNEVAGGIAAAFWISNGDNAIFEHNSASDGVAQPVKGNYDSMAYDIDQDTRNTTFQYNLSFDNGGGGFMFCLNSTHGVFRDNISIADGTRSLRGCSGSLTNAQFYNNDIIVDPGSHASNLKVIDFGTETGPVSFRNNLVQVSGGSVSWPTYGNIRVDHNLIFGVAPPSDATSTIAASPDVVDGEDISADGMKLLAGSPALRAGVPIADNGGLDYFGNRVSPAGTPNIGADDGAGQQPGPARGQAK
jgi:hypothetical protein